MKAPIPTTRWDLIQSIKQGLQPKWLFFWGHTPSADGTITKSCCSQWWSGHPFVLNGAKYLTAEHYMMAEKARLFGDLDTRAKILTATNPAVAKKLGREVSGFDDAVWSEKRWEIVVEGNLAKFAQHEDLRTFLLRTGDRVLVEASPFDAIWGIGLAATHSDAEMPQNWKGLNLLGFALMEVRRNLQSVASATL